MVAKRKAGRSVGAPAGRVVTMSTMPVGKPVRAIAAPIARAAAAATAWRSPKIHAYAQQVYKKTGGPTPALREVYGAYLANQKRTQARG
jgi:hypothetical protein